MIIMVLLCVTCGPNVDVKCHFHLDLLYLIPLPDTDSCLLVTAHGKCVFNKSQYDKTNLKQYMSCSIFIVCPSVFPQPYIFSPVCF